MEVDLALPPFDAPLSAYQDQADRLLRVRRSGDPRALEFVRRFHPAFRDPKLGWRALEVPLEQVAKAPFEGDDARVTVARALDFADWVALVDWVEAVATDPAVRAFETAVEAVVDGDLDALRTGLRDTSLVHARSTRRCFFDPPVHRATLLHYVAANGVESHRQRTPANAPDVARTLLAAGAEVDALADFYGQPCTTLPLLVSSSHPAEAGVQGELIEVLIDHGAALEGHGESWDSPLLTALVFGYRDAAEVLERRGAHTDRPAILAGLGRVDALAASLSSAAPEERHLALALAAQLGQADALRVLLDAGEDPDRYNPPGAHAHSTPLHQAALAGHRAVVELLIARGARLDLEDRIYSGTPRGWAQHGGRAEVEALLERAGG
jgi:ankyrin repeat protein